MYGTKGKIGVIVPSLNNTLEPEFNRMVPDGFAIYATRLPLERGLPEDLKAMAEEVEFAGRLLKHAEVDVIAYCCTSGSLIEGADWDEALSQRIQEVTNLPVITTASSVVSAMKKLELKSVSVATPYIDQINEIERHFIENHGISVTNIEGLNIVTGAELHQLDQVVAKSFCRTSADHGSDGLFISCTDFAAIDFIEELENDLNKPVFTSNTATLWNIMRIMKSNQKIMGFGSLLAS